MYRSTPRPRLALLVAAALAITTLARTSFAQPRPLDFKSREVQEGRNFIQRLVATLAVGKSTGQGTYEFDFELPAGRGVQPRLVLSYASGAGLSELGDGWALSVPTIERSYQYGPPGFSASDRFRLRSGHEAQDLVATGEVTVDGWAVFREESERSYARYLFKGNSWRVLGRDGIRLELGLNAAARRGLGTRATVAQTAAWQLEQMIDSHGNQATFVYGDGGGQAALLRQIRYSANPAIGLAPQFTVDLTWEPFFSPDLERMVSYRKGYRELFGVDRLARVTVTAPPHATTGSPAAVPANSPASITYTLTHGTTSPAPGAGFRLERVQIADRPPAEFGYSAPWPSGTSFKAAAIWPGELDPTATLSSLGRTDFSGSGDLASTRITVADVTGDGLPDLVDSHSECASGGGWVVWRNQHGSFRAERWQRPSALFGPQPPDPCALRQSERFGTTTITTQEFLDLTGDGLPDLAYWQGTTTWVCRGTGTGLAQCEPWGILPAGVPAGVFRREDDTFGNFSVTDVDLVDFNGDGLVDRVASVFSGSPRINVVLNNGGQGWGAQTSWAMPGCGSPFFLACLRLTERIIAGTSNRRLVTELRDVNGDGLPDVLTTGISGAISVGWGTGRDFEGLRPMHHPPAALGLGHESSGGDYRAELDLIDLNGDGLPEVVEMPAGASALSVRYNHGGGWDATAVSYPLSPPPAGSFHPRALTMVTSVPSAHSDTRSMLLDLDGDGLAELVTTPLMMAGSGSIATTPLAYRPPRFLTHATSLNNNVETRFDYAALPGVMPFAVHVPVALHQQRTAVYLGEAPRQIIHDTSYVYSEPVYDRTERVFRGFRTVVETDQGYGRVVTTNYLTSKYAAGIVESEVVANVDGDSVPQTTINYYTEVPLPGGARFVRLDRRQLLDGLLLNWRLSEVGYADYYFGAAQTVIRRGDVLDPDDDVTLVTGYVVRSDSSHLLVLPNRITHRRGGQIVADTRHYYDSRTQFGAAPTKGNLLRTSQRRSSVLSVTFDAFYDDETVAGTGMLIRYRDPMGAELQYSYDPTYRQFPVREVSAVGTVHYSYHALYGVLSDVCGPQSLGATWRCTRSEIDRYGRLTARHVPVLRAGGFERTLTEVVSYDDHIYPLRQQVTLRPGARDMARAVRYLDGFGHVVQTRIEETRDLFRVTDQATDLTGKLQWVSQPRRTVGAGFEPTGDPGRQAARFAYDYVRGATERHSFPRDAGDLRPPAMVRHAYLGSYVRDIDAQGRETVSDLDGFGRVATRRRLSPQGDAITAFQYDASDRLVALIDPNGQTTSYTYNDLGWLLKATMPDLGEYQYSHNARGQLVEEVDPRGVTTAITYDQAARPTRTYTLISQGNVRPIDEVTTYYSAAGDSSQLGRVASREADGVRHQYRYHESGRMASVTASSSSIVASTSNSYSADGRLIAVEYPDGWQVDYSYFLDGTPRSVTDRLTGNILAEVLLDDNGRPSVVTSAMGLEETYVYDARQRVKRVISANLNVSATPLVDDTFDWSDASEVTRLERRGMAPGLIVRPDPDVLTMKHDGLGRLAAVSTNGAATAEYLYDRGGRFLRKREGAADSEYLYGADQLLLRFGSATASYKYDAAGNVVSEYSTAPNAPAVARLLAWDAVGRLSSVEEQGATSAATEYHYLGDGLGMVLDRESGHRWMHVGELARIDLDSGQSVDRVWFGPRLVAERRDGIIEYIHRTIGGTVAAVTSAGGQTLWQEEFVPFGATLDAAGSQRHESGFHGVRSDELLVAGPRAYDPASGRWFARDPLLRDPAAFTAQLELDGYGFAYARPYEFRDPSGLQPDPREEYASDEGGPPPDGYYVDSRGKYVRLDPDVPPDIQAPMNHQEHVLGVLGPSAAASNVMLDMFEQIPFVGSAVMVARGKTGEGLAWLGVDIASVGVGKLAVRGAVAGYRALRAMRAAARVAAVSCFPAGTSVTTTVGPRPIESIREGDQVACADPAGRWTTCVVHGALRRSYEGAVMTITVDRAEVEATADHPFWVVRGAGLDLRPAARHLSATDGRAVTGRWVDASSLRVGDVIEVNGRRPVTVTALASRYRRMTVFNLQVGGHHTFAVGAAGLLVHNRPMATGWVRAMQVVQAVSGAAKARFQCKAFAAEFKAALRKAGVNGTHVTVQYAPSQFGYSATQGMLTSHKGMTHEFIVVGDIAFDNMNPNGIPYAQFADDLGLDEVARAGGELFQNSF